MRPHRFGSGPPPVRSDGDEGFTLVELLVSSLLLLIGFAAALGVISTTLVQSRSTRAADGALAVANAQVERYRSLKFENLELGADYSGSSTYEGLPVAQDPSCSSTCVAHTETVTEEGVTYVITRWILNVDDPIDDTGVDDEDGDTVDYKRIVVQVDWSGVSSGSHTIRTNVLPDESTPSTVVQGVTFRILDESGDLREDEDVHFDVTVTTPTAIAYTDQTAEGVADIYGIPAGANTCLVEPPDTDWRPVGGSAGEAVSGSCAVSGGDVTTFTSEWVYDPCTSGGADGVAQVTVTDTSGDAVSGATVSLSGPASYSATTDGSGVAVFDPAAAGIYSVSASATDYTSASGQLCVRSGQTATASYALGYTGGGASEAPGEDDVLLRVTVTNSDDKDHTFRLEIEADNPKPAGYEDKVYTPSVIIAAGTTANVDYYVPAATYKKIRLQRLKLGKTDDWDKKAEWKDQVVSSANDPHVLTKTVG